MGLLYTLKHNKYLLILLFIFLINGSECTINDSVLILTCSHHKPEFIELQQKSFAKLLKNPYKLVVINDASSESMAQNIEDTCKKVGAQCLRFRQEWHNLPYIPHNEGLDYNFPSLRHSNCMQFALNMVGLHHNGVVLVIDNDAFLVKPFDINEYMSNCDIAGFLRPAIDWTTKAHVIYDYKHLWPPVMIFNMGTLPNKHTLSLSSGLINQNVWVDSGGGTYTYLKNNPNARLKEFNLLNFNPIPGNVHPNFLQFGDPYYTLEETKNTNLTKGLGLDDKAADFLKKGPVEVQFFLNGTFFHYMSAGNWMNRPSEWHELKSTLIHEYLHNVIEDNLDNSPTNLHQSDTENIVTVHTSDNNNDEIISSSEAHEDVLILICNSENPYFIEQQYLTFSKYLTDAHRLIVINDAPGNITQQNIHKVCESHNIKYVKLTNIHKDPQLRQSYVLQYALDNIACNHPGLVVFIDSEVFLMRSISLRKIMQGYQIGGYLRSAQISKENFHPATQCMYLWPALMIFDMKNLPDKEHINLHGGTLKEKSYWTGTGGNTYHYLKQHPEIKVKLFNTIGINIVPSLLKPIFNLLNIPYYTVGQSKKLTLLQRLGFTQPEIEFITTGIPNIQYIADNNFLHYMNDLSDSTSSNLQLYKSNIFKKYLEKILRENNPITA